MTDLRGVNVSDEDMAKIERLDDAGVFFTEFLLDRQQKNDAGGCDSLVLFARAYALAETKDAARMIVQGMDGRVGSEA